MDESDAPLNRSNDDAEISKSSDEHVSKNSFYSFAKNVSFSFAKKDFRIHVIMVKMSINRIKKKNKKSHHIVFGRFEALSIFVWCDCVAATKIDIL